MPISICKSISFVCGVKCLSTSKGRGRLLIRLGNSATLGPLANAYLITEMRQVRQFSNLSNLCKKQLAVVPHFYNIYPLNLQKSSKDPYLPTL